MNPYLKADELTRRQFVSNAARAYLGVHLFPMLGSNLASAAPAAAAKGGTAKSVTYLNMSGGMSHLDTFDPKLEPEATRNLYGSGRFAKGCLLARRLVQNGVRFIEVQLGGWDTHYDNFTGVGGRCQEFDQAYAALISDLDMCGKLHDTLVVVATALRQRHHVAHQAPLQNRRHGRAGDHAVWLIRIVWQDSGRRTRVIL